MRIDSELRDYCGDYQVELLNAYEFLMLSALEVYTIKLLIDSSIEPGNYNQARLKVTLGIYSWFVPINVFLIDCNFVGNAEDVLCTGSQL